MSFNFVGGPSAPKTTGSSFSFPTLTTSTAGSTGITSGFSFGSTMSAPTSSASPFSFGTTPAASTASGATGGFFSTPAATTQPPAPTTSLFSGPPAASTASTFSFSAPAATTASTGFTGFQLTTSTPASTPASTAASTLQFGGPTPKLPEPAKSATPALQAAFFSPKPAGGLLLGQTPATTTTTTTTPASTSSGFPTLLTGQTSAPSTTTTTTTATLGLGTTPTLTLDTTASTATTTAAAAPASLPTSTPILASLTTATSTSSSSVAPAPGAATPGLSVAGLEEKVNKWMSELREQEERLMRQAAHVNAWDQLLQQGHDQVQQLRHTLNNVKTDQNRLQAELDFIQGQQQELEQLIDPLEAAAASTTPAQHQGDRQRENMHLVAQNLDSQLRQITDDLCKVIEHLNSSNSGSRASDPVNTVARVLSAHMDTLKWVDQNSALLSQKIDELSRTSDNKRRD